MKSCGLLIIALLAPTHPASAIESPILLKESVGVPPVGAPNGCSLEPNLTGDCGNLRYYNLCSSYIWIYSADLDVGVRFDGPCISVGNSIERVITYFRNTVPGYGQTVAVSVNADTENDGCPDYVVAEEPYLDPALRWNCTELGNTCIPADAQAIVVRTRNSAGGPTFATDGANSEGCDPIGTPHSYYYGHNGDLCLPWRGPTSRDDNFLYWLIVDSGCPPTSTETLTWGKIKALYR